MATANISSEVKMRMWLCDLKLNLVFGMAFYRESEEVEA
jgi:hypothetical protein